jgi:hypothetical protein
MNTSINLSPAIIDQFAQAFLQGGLNLHSNLSAVADSLYGSLLLLTFSWFTLGILFESMTGEHLGRVMVKLIRFLFQAGLVAWFLQAYNSIFYDGLYQGCVTITNQIAGTGGSGQGFATGWSVFADIIVSIWDAIGGSPTRYTAGATPLSAEFWAALGGWMVTVMLLGVALLVFILALVILAVIHVMGSALAGLALALGPFFIPFLLWETTRDYFVAWLRFLFIACFYQVISVAVLVMAKPVFQQLQAWVSGNVSALSGGSATDSMVIAVLLIVTASILTYLMGHVPQITAALIGHARVDTGFATGTSRQIQSSLKKANDWMGKRLQNASRER